MNRELPALFRLLMVMLAIMVLPTVALSEDAPYRKMENIRYAESPGTDPDLQSLDVYYHTPKHKSPVIIYIHGGGWAFGDKADVYHKPDFFLKQGIAFISMNYRLRWDYQLIDQAEDVVSVIDWARTNADKYGFDPEKLILMGHGAGAHLAALVATDPSYLSFRQLYPGDISAVVAIDTLSFDIPRVMHELGNFLERRQHELIFGKDESAWLAASPIHHVAVGKALPGFALLYVADNEATMLQARAFAKKLSSASADAIMIPGNDKTTDSIDMDLGKEDDNTSRALMTFLKAKI
ncbi:MAG: alpha/beta hydrolase [Pseudomonadales bacterium]|nr:alpha/beta hydrolase [Pseudomonadales bacterium]